MNADGITLTEIGQAALDYADRGWHVFPAPPGTKRSHKSAEHSDGRAWGATISPAEIKRDWNRWPSANVGITTGPASGIFVLDLDCKNGVDGIQWLKDRIAEHGELPHTVEAVSPSGGWHVWFSYPRDFDVKTCEGLIAPGVDVRGRGGMVLAVPSIKPGVGSYAWKNPPGFFEVADAPQWLLDLLPRCGETRTKSPAGTRIDVGGNSYGEKALREEIAGVWAAPEGTRNGALNKAAFNLGQLVAGGELHAWIVADRLTSAAQAVGLDLAETIATIRSGMDAGMKEPRSRPAGTVQARADAPSPPPERTSRFYSAAELDGRPVPARQWLVDGLVPMKTVTLFGGDGGTGKSLLALMLAASAATGRAWLNMAVPKGRALFLSAEDDDDELHMRLADICRGMGLRLADLGGLTMRSLAGEDALLAVETKIALMQTALFDEIEARAKDEQPSLIVLDTLADMFPANENDRAAVRQFISILRGLALRQKCAVVLLSHPSLTGLTSGSGTSGSTAWNNSVRSRLYLERIVQDGYEADPDKRVLSTKKANYGRIGGEISMTWREGVFVRDAEPQGLDALAAGAKAERVFLSILDAYTAQGRYVSAQPGPTYAPTQFARHPDAEGCTKRALASAMESLLTREVVVIGYHGKGSDKRSHLERAGRNPPPNPGDNEVATPVATPSQPPPNGVATYTPNTPSVATALSGGSHATLEDN